MTARTGPLSSAPFPGIRQAYIRPHATVQIRKNDPKTAPADPPPLRTSAPTTVPQYPSPISTVSTEAQRNHHKARDIRSGSTLPLVAGSRPFMNGRLTDLKKYNRPIQVMPPTKCNQRNIMRRFVLASVGRLIFKRGSCSGDSLTAADSQSARLAKRTIVDNWRGK